MEDRDNTRWPTYPPASNPMEREIDDIKRTLERMEAKLDILIPQAAAQDERIKNLERQLRWIWTVTGGVIVAVMAELLHMLR